MNGTVDPGVADPIGDSGVQGTPQIVTAIWTVLCLGLAGMNDQLLPEKYFLDSQHIQQLALLASSPTNDSFGTTAWVYSVLGGFAVPELTQLITFLLFLVLLFRCAPWLGISRFGPVEVVLLCFSGTEAAIYLAQYSKESIVVLVVLTLVLVPTNAAGEFFFVVVACLYAAVIREYWFIITALYLCMRGLLRLRRPVWIAVFTGSAVLILAIGVSVVMHVDLNSFRQAVAQKDNLYSQTAIQEYIPVRGPLGAAANALVTLVLLAVPAPLIITGSPVYLVFAVVMAVLWWRLFATVREGMRQRLFRADVRVARACALLLATLPTLAIFEPDYGSYIKHLTPLLPLFLLPLRARREMGAHARRPAPPTLSDPAFPSRGPSS